MPGYGDLGIPGFLLAIIVVPVVTLFVRHKWRLARSREEEIRRLLILASQESARAELESTLQYAYTYSSPALNPVDINYAYSYSSPSVQAPSSSSVSAKIEVPNVVHQQYCAVCYLPTTTRCSRCKAVRYCSGRCQIIHWRKGHKDECHPPSRTISSKTEAENCSKVNATLDGSRSVDPNVGKEKDSGTGFVDSPTKVLGSSFTATCRRANDDAETLEASSERSNAAIDAPTASSPLRFSECTDGSRISTDDCDFVSPVPVSCLESQSATQSAMGSQMPARVADSNEETVAKVSSSGSADGTGISDSVNNTTRSGHLVRKRITHDGIPTHHVTTATGSTSCYTRSEDSVNSDTSTSASEFVETTHSSAHSFHNSNCEDSAMASSRNGCDSSGVPLSHLNNVSDQSPPLVPQSSSTSGSHSNGYTQNKHRAKGMHAFGSMNSGSNITASLKTSMRKVVQQFRTPKLSKHKPPGYGNEIAVKPSKVIFPYDLFVKLYNEKVDLHPFGLENCGNSCYANAVLQCLVFTPPLTSFLLQGLHTKQCKRAEWCFTCEFEKLVSQSREKKLPLSPIRILSKIHSIGSKLGYGKEEDAHEFLRYVIDTMQHPEEAGGHGSGSFIEEKALLRLTFGGHLRSNIKCLKCDSKSVKYERMMDLTVGIDGDIRTLEEALKQFTAPETLDNDNKYLCERCKSYVKARKRLTVYEAPNVLTIVLKRFQSGKFGKINKAVRFPEELDLTPYMSNQDERSGAYKLYAVVEHLDVMNASFSGHYVCYVKNKHDKWYKINDSKVKPVEPERVLTEGAYMLLYARLSPRPPMLVRSANGGYLSRKSGFSEADLLKRSHSTPRSRDTLDNLSERTVQRADDAFRSESFSSYDGHQLLFHRVVADSSSDSSSLFSCSDEASCSTESTRDSTSTDDYSGYKFGDPGHWGCNSPTSVSEASGGCSPSTVREQERRHHPSANSVHKSSPTKVNYDGFPRTGRRQWTRTEAPLFLYSDHTNVCSKTIDGNSSKRTTEVTSEVLGYAYSNENRHDMNTRWSS